MAASYDPDDKWELPIRQIIKARRPVDEDLSIYVHETIRALYEKMFLSV